jgi:GNAT superfamily N-acetyltransferase
MNTPQLLDPGLFVSAEEVPARPSPEHPWRWVPIRSLAQAHRPRVLQHLLSLPTADRYLRFGYAASDEQIGRYVDSIDFDKDEVFGIYNRRLVLIAVAHLAYDRPAQLPERPPMVEFGVSVLPQVRARGLGTRLFEHALIRSRNRQTDTLFIHALSENAAMLKIARRAGAIVERDGTDSCAWLKLPPDTLASHVEQHLEVRAAEADYQFKRYAKRWGRWLDMARGLRHRLSRSAAGRAIGHKD